MKDTIKEGEMISARARTKFPFAGVILTSGFPFFAVEIRNPKAEKRFGLRPSDFEFRV
jgi:hypothetical protein